MVTPLCFDGVLKQTMFFLDENSRKKEKIDGTLKFQERTWKGQNLLVIQK